MNNNDNNSGVNTILIVVLTIIVVAGLVWFFVRQAPAAPETEQDAGFQVDVNMPEETGGETAPPNGGEGSTE